MWSRRAVFGGLACGAAFAALGRLPARGADEPLARLAEGGRALLMRHAQAPGVGDPPGFRPGECASQRNLDDVGRAQARALGARLRAAGIARAEVRSSRWCRCLETAALLGLGPVEPLAALDSFFARPGERDPSTTALRRFLAERDPAGGALVMVTHQVNITALTGVSPASGEALVLRIGGAAPPVVEARVPVEG